MANEEIEISELEFTEELAGDNLLPVESSTDTKATSLQILKNWLSSFFVGKTGNETIEGEKLFTTRPTIEANTSSKLFLKSKIIDVDNPPTEGQTNQLWFVDKNGYQYAVLQANQNADGNMSFSMTMKSKKENQYATLSVAQTAVGDSYTSAPKSEAPNSIVTTISKSKAGNGYYKLGNGLIIQWGVVPHTSANGTVTYPTPFGSLSRVATSITDSGTLEPRVIRVYDTSPTNFKYSCYKQNASGASNTATSFMWLAVGY